MRSDPPPLMPSGQPDLASVPHGLSDALQFPLLQAILGRRSRRFFLGASIPDGPFAYTSPSPPSRFPSWSRCCS